MASFTFNVEGQHLRETDHRIVVSGSVNYLSAEFTFSEDWGDIPKISFWTKGSVTHKIMLIDDKISPDDGIYLTDGNWLVSVLGEDVDGETIKKRITTNEVYVHVEHNGPTEGDPFEDITPSIGEQIVGKANKSAEEASEYADEAKRSEENAKLHRDEARQAEDQAEASAKSASKSAQDAHDSAEEAKKTVEDLPEKVDEYIDSHKDELKGEPGYTPQKGIDYFDGAPGYTPQKGIDYFDGEPGEPGKEYDDTEIRRLISGQNENIAKKLDKPTSGIAVGKYFRVASVDAEGNPVLEAVDLPISSANVAGLLKANGYYGVNIDSSNRIYANKMSKEIYGSTNDNTFIGKGTLENVLAERLKEPQFELIEEITLEADAQNIERISEPNGVPYDFIELVVEFNFPKADATSARYIYTSAYCGSKGLTNYIGLTTRNDYAQRGTVEFYSKGKRLTGGSVATTLAYGAFPNGSCDQSNYQRNASFISVTKNIDRIQARCSNNIPNGTVIKIFAIRA